MAVGDLRSWQLVKLVTMMGGIVVRVLAAGALACHGGGGVDPGDDGDDGDDD